MPTLFCQRWREHRSSYRPAGETINPADFEIHPIDYMTAKQFVVTHHYSRSYVACRYRFGLFSRVISNSHWETHGLEPQLVGAAIFSTPQHPAVLTNVFPGNANDSVELGRFILLDEVKANAESYFLSRCLHALRKEGLRGVVAFSDDQARPSIHGTFFPGHIGTIYQSLGVRLSSVGEGPKRRSTCRFS